MASTVGPEGGSRAALIVPVGGTPAAPAQAIRTVGPTHVAFLVSGQTEPEVSKIETELGRVLPWKRIIRTPDAENLNETYRVLTDTLPQILDEWRIGWTDVTVDLTGGTKVMTAALVLATAPAAPRYLYVGGRERDRAGAGVVVTGTERPVQTLNPWDEFATDRLRRLAWAFNNLQFAAAASLAREALDHASLDRRAYLEALASFVDGFAAWDRFNFEVAQKKIDRSLPRLAQEWRHRPTYADLTREVQARLETLATLIAAQRAEAPSEWLLRDLMSNAVRRGEQEGRYDDGVARLYRFIEGLAQRALWDEYRIPTGKVPLDVLPSGPGWDALRSQQRAFGQDSVELGLQRAYDLLAARGHPLGEMAPRLQRGGDIGKLLVSRNSSLLAHGTTPIQKGAFEGLLRVCLAMPGWARGELIAFPRLPEG